MNQLCHDFDEEINFLSEISPNDLPWDLHRSNSQDIAELYSLNLGYVKYSQRINDCSGYLEFAVVDGKLVLKKAWFCRVRYCSTCQWRRSLKVRAVMYKHIDRVICQYPSHRWIFLTLTVKNPDAKDLKQTLKEMNAGWQRLIQTKKFKGVVDGFIRTTEITRPTRKGLEHQVHPHFHVMLLVKSTYFKGNSYIKQTEWTNMWIKAMRLDYYPQVNVKTIKLNKKKSLQENQNQLHDAIKETFKYSVKPSDMLAYDDDGRWLCEITKQTHKMRFLATGGVLKHALKEDVTNTEMIAPEGDMEQSEGEDDAPRITFTYAPHYRRYIYKF